MEVMDFLPIQKNLKHYISRCRYKNKTILNYKKSNLNIQVKFVYFLIKIKKYF